MQIGAIITKGPSNWQILQQTDGFAGMELEGSWVSPPGTASSGKVFARILNEETGYPVIPWKECDTTADGKWSTSIQNVPAGGLYRLETCFCADGNTAIEWSIRGDMIHHIGVGDLFVIAGQSNAAGYGKDPVYDPPETGVHVLRNSGTWDLASHPLADSTNIIHEDNRELCNCGNSPYLAFGKILKKELHYPIGLIQTALGASPLREWNPEESGVLYRNMINIIRAAGGRIKGILWYQGCSDTDSDEAADTYLQRFETMVRNIRSDLGDASIPLLTVQLNRCVIPPDSTADVCWGKIREAQRQAAKTIENVFIVPSTDLSLADEIHNSSTANIVLGERLAWKALMSLYGRKGLFAAPEISKAERVGNAKVRLIFNNIVSRLTIYRSIIEKPPFTIEDEGGKVILEGWEQEKENEVVFTLGRDIKGKAFVHGIYERNPVTDVPKDVNSYLPVLSFYGLEVL